jgi:hypothetical protein
MNQSTLRIVRLLMTSLGTALLAACGGGGGGGSAPAAPATYLVVANVSGLSGSGLVLALGNGTNVNVSGNGAVTLATGLSTGAAYSVTIDTQPINPVQTCSVSGGSGNVTGSNAMVAVSCVAGTATTVNTAKATVTIDSSVPASVSSIITQIVSPLDSQKPGTQIFVPISEIAGESLVLAIDANSNIVLASLTTTNTVNLSANSTALALVRLAIGALPNSGVSGQLNKVIQATAEFPNLVALISAGLTANMSPVTSSAVYSSIATVLTQLPAPAVAALQSSNRARAHAQAAPVDSPSVTTSLPYELVNFSTKLPQTVAVTGVVAATGNLQVSNSTLIAWALASATTSGQSLCLPNGVTSSNNPDCSVVIPQTGLLNDLGSIVSSSAISSGTVEGDGGGSFNLALEQNYLSHYKNVSQIGTDLVATIAFFSTAGVSASLKSCVDSFFDAALPPEQIADLAANPTGAGLESYLEGEFSAVSLAKTLLECASSLFPSTNAGSWTFAQSITAFAFGLSSFALSEVSAVATAAGLPAEIYWTVSYWPYGKDTFGVCEAQSPPPTLVISNCAQSFTFTPATVTLVPTDSFTPTVGMTSINGVTPSLNAYLGPTGSGATTLVPPDLEYSSSQDGTVIDLNANTGVVQALALSSGQMSAQANVTVTETSTGLNASYTVTVNSVPTISVTSSVTSLPAAGGPAAFTVTLGPPLGAVAGSPVPTQSVSFSDSAGLLCTNVMLSDGIATCSPTTVVPPDKITATYFGDSVYTGTSGSVSIAVAVSASSYTYTYTGLAFTVCEYATSGNPCPSGPLTMTATFSISAGYSGTVQVTTLNGETPMGPALTGLSIAIAGDPSLPAFGPGDQLNALSFTFENGSIVGWFINAFYPIPGLGNPSVESFGPPAADGLADYVSTCVICADGSTEAFNEVSGSWSAGVPNQ